MSDLVPHQEVINSQPRTLIIGHGWVGRHMAQYFTEADIVDVNGFVRKRYGSGYELGIVAVPTPMGEDGRCDTSIVEEVVRKWRDEVGIFLIKSTVGVGTTDRLCREYGVRAVFSPEYIGETLGHPLREPRRDIFVILGGEKQARETVARHFKTVLHADARFYLVDAKTAELCKYMENCWLATKVTFCNEFYDLARAFGVNYEELREVWLADPRITRSHTFVYENNRGFGGKCLPKDLSALCYAARRHGVRAELIEFILELNKKFRKMMTAKDADGGASTE